MKRFANVVLILLAVIVFVMPSVTALGAEIDPVFGRELVTLTDADIAADEALNNVKHMESPAWSPDGTMIAFVGFSSLYVVPAAGGVPKQVWNLVLKVISSVTYFYAAFFCVASLMDNFSRRRFISSLVNFHLKDFAFFS